MEGGHTREENLLGRGLLRERVLLVFGLIRAFVFRQYRAMMLNRPIIPKIVLLILIFICINQQFRDLNMKLSYLPDIPLCLTHFILLGKNPFLVYVLHRLQFVTEAYFFYLQSSVDCSSCNGTGPTCRVMCQCCYYCKLLCTV